MTQRDWQRHDGHVVGLFLNGQEFPYLDAEGQRIVDDSFLLLVNAHHEDVTFTLPGRRWGLSWAVDLSTDEPELEAGARTVRARQPVVARSRSVTVLRREEPR
jgi:glycogen operon protein